MAPDHTITLDDSTFQSLLTYLRKNDKVDLLNALMKTPQATQIPSVNAMRTFEVTAMGFDGSSDETDDRVFWVKAHSAEEVKSAIEGTNAGFHDQIDCDSDIDFELPAQVAELREALMQFEHGLNGQNHPVVQRVQGGGQRGMRCG